MSTLNDRNTIPFVYGYLSVLSILIICIFEQLSQTGISLTIRNIPLIVFIGGFLPSIIIQPYTVPVYLRYLYRCALFALSIYLILQGISEIYDIATTYMDLYLIASLLCFALTFMLGIGTYIYHRFYLQHKVRKQ